MGETKPKSKSEKLIPEAIVLAAGEGSRLGKLTKRKPKALLRVAGMHACTYGKRSGHIRA
ncbi:MAG: hypothetical protein OEY81_03440 [Candidatus Bathyarchaeota archaeon]|nr:hypothetical protein [Candidatus Bathyarchaeota archaeon]